MKVSIDADRGQLHDSSSDHFCGCSTKTINFKRQWRDLFRAFHAHQAQAIFLVRDCPGGIRFWRRVSGLMMSASVILQACADPWFGIWDR